MLKSFFSILILAGAIPLHSQTIDLAETTDISIAIPRGNVKVKRSQRNYLVINNKNNHFELNKKKDKSGTTITLSPKISFFSLPNTENLQQVTVDIFVSPKTKLKIVLTEGTIEANATLDTISIKGGEVSVKISGHLNYINIYNLSGIATLKSLKVKKLNIKQNSGKLHLDKVKIGKKATISLIEGTIKIKNLTPRIKKENLIRVSNSYFIKIKKNKIEYSTYLLDGKLIID